MGCFMNPAHGVWIPLLNMATPFDKSSPSGRKPVYKEHDGPKNDDNDTTTSTGTAIRIVRSCCARVRISDTTEDITARPWYAPISRDHLLTGPVVASQHRVVRRGCDRLTGRPYSEVQFLKNHKAKTARHTTTRN